ncbi:hypothetical protein [Rhodococcus qingshengii]|uniref:hypothetical protein n=1 Tax=Rhodococcus qingshengii TaxID=334542 RepID=UPI001AE04938|nr:hypothetical protein [Rhodococcus qingshengii]
MTAVAAVQRQRALAAIEVYEAALEEYELPSAPLSEAERIVAADRVIAAAAGLRAAIPM